MVRLENEALVFLKNPSDEMATRWINGWNDDLNGKLLNSARERFLKRVETWIPAGLSVPVYARFDPGRVPELSIEVPLILKKF